MSGGIEVTADAATGALPTRAVEPWAGESPSRCAHGVCLNCGTALIGTHCHSCGQAAHVHRTMGAIFHDIGHSVFHFDGKMSRTLPMLALRPGELTRRYVAGERARFVSPMAFFLFTVFLMFAVVANLPGWSFGDITLLKVGATGGVAEARGKLTEERVKAEADIRGLRERLAEARSGSAPNPADVASLGRRLATAQEARDDLAQAERLLPIPTTFNQAGVPPARAENWLEQKYREAKTNPKLLLYKVKTSAYKFSWALIPISLPLIWLLFPLRRDVGFYDHAVFATYSLTFMSLLTILLALLGAIGVGWQWLFFAAILIPPLHIYRQLKDAYHLTRLGAVWRTFWMLTFAFTASTMFALLLLYLGVAD